MFDSSRNHRLVTPDSFARQVADALAFRNGMAMMPDNSTLIVAKP
jgi:sugar lactone lactonase YvrE